MYLSECNKYKLRWRELMNVHDEIKEKYSIIILPIVELTFILECDCEITYFKIM